MRRAYKFRLRPTAGQHLRLQACLDDHRELYNAALQERRAAYERVVRRSAGYFGPDRPKMPVRYSTQSAQLKQIGAANPGKVKTVQVRREGRTWMLVLSCDDVAARPLEPTGAVVGIDVGIASFAVTSAGAHIDNPRWARKAAGKLQAAQKVLARKKRGSANRGAARQTVATRHRKVANQRRDFHHKTARALVADHDVITVEDLKIANMVRRAKPRPDPDIPGVFLANGQAAKTGLNRSISNAGWAQFRSILAAKAEEAGRQMIGVDPRHTSDRCEACGHATKENRVKQAAFKCVRCGHETHADEHAARNILRAGLALLTADQAA